MLFKRITPSKSLNRFIECFWILEDSDTQSKQQKIISDGFPEIIFHFGDPYRINLHNAWKLQSDALLAGQITKHFLLENTGRSDVFGIKFKPAAITLFFSLSMDLFLDKVVSLRDLHIPLGSKLHAEINKSFSAEEKVFKAEEYLSTIHPDTDVHFQIAEKAVELIFETKGAIIVTQLCKDLFVSERQLQRVFKKFIGLSPKFYSRIIRFNYIFELMKKGPCTWADITYDGGYFDQSHFIRDFKSFTGEDPSKYYFQENNIANFFLKKGNN
jgi:AraC-like DNA-binding protein